MLSGLITVPTALRLRCGLLTYHRLSDNAGAVKYFFRALPHPLRDERHFALVEISAIPTTARSQSVSGQISRSDPCISSVACTIMITTADSSLQRSGTPNQ